MQHNSSSSIVAKFDYETCSILISSNKKNFSKFPQQHMIHNVTADIHVISVSLKPLKHLRMRIDPRVKHLDSV